MDLSYGTASRLEIDSLPTPRVNPEVPFHISEPGAGGIPVDAQEAHTSVAELEQSIQPYIGAHNADPKPFVLHKTADAILASVAKAAAELD
jgi:hypothetical protein